MSTSGLEGSLFFKTERKCAKKWPDIQLNFYSASPPDDGLAENFNILSEVVFYFANSFTVVCALIAL